jgi:hypothetical protein
MRKAYTKPGMTRVNLVPSEAVLLSCKDMIFSGIPGGANGCIYGPEGHGGGYSCKVSGS